MRILVALRVEHFEIRARGDAFGGATFGDVGAYEKIEATVHAGIDRGHAST